MKMTIGLLVAMGVLCGASVAQEADFKTTYAAAYKLYRSKDRKGALAGFEQALKLARKPADKGAALYMIGYNRLSLKQYDEALKAFDSIIEGKLPSTYTMLGYYYKGETLSLRKEYPEALAAYREALTLAASNPKYKARSLVKIGSTLITLKKPEEAVAAMKQIVENPKAVPSYRASAYELMGVAYKQMGKMDECQKAYVAALAVPKMAVWRRRYSTVALASIYLAEKKYSAARAICEKLANDKKARPYDKGVLYYYIGNAYEGEGNKEQAIACYKKVLELKKGRVREAARELKRLGKHKTPK